MSDIQDQNKKIYEVCKQKRTKPDPNVDSELTKEIARNYRTLPSFEKTVFDYIHVKHYSLQRNELMKCRWSQYRKHIEERVFAPFQFPEHRDLHFYNAAIRFLPALSIHKHPDQRMKLKPGPGVDIRGQMPIPQELLMKRGRIEKEDKTKRRISRKVKNEKILQKPENKVSLTV